MYVGRFAPSPTGPLHLGSLLAAVGSYADARHHQGQWLLRIEDVDTTRARPGVAEEQQRTLRAFGMQWDGPVVVQSKRVAAYAAALEQLENAGQVFACACTRQQLPPGQPYPGTCADGPAARTQRTLGPGAGARGHRVR